MLHVILFVEILYVYYRQISNISRTIYQTLNVSCRLAFVFIESMEARYYVEYEDVVGAAPTGDAPTTSQWSTILLLTRVRLISEVLRYILDASL